MASHPMKGASAFEPASVVYVPVAAAPPSYYRYPKKLSIVLGEKQILFGVLCIVFSSVPVASLGVLAIISQPGIWSGILFIITGVLGIAAGMRKKKRQIVANMVMCIISASFTFFLVLYGVIGAYVIYSERLFRCSPQMHADYEFCRSDTVVVAMESCVAVTGIIEAVLLIWGSVLCCKSGACCCSGSYQQMSLSPEYVQPMVSKHCDGRSWSSSDL